jgi:hypothetical protein
MLHQPHFKQRAALDRLAERLLDLNRSIGRPDKLSTIFGYRITKAYRGGLKTQIADHHLGNPVIRSEYKDSSVKQYVRDHRVLRNEATSYNTLDLGWTHAPHSDGGSVHGDRATVVRRGAPQSRRSDEPIVAPAVAARRIIATLIGVRPGWLPAHMISTSPGKNHCRAARLLNKQEEEKREWLVGRVEAEESRDD